MFYVNPFLSVKRELPDFTWLRSWAHHHFAGFSGAKKDPMKPWYFWFLAPLLWPLSLLYGALFLLDRWRKRRTWYKKTDIFVISIGNITTGGTGKTPFTLWLSHYLLTAHKIRAAVLMRGYRSPIENQQTIIDVAKDGSWYLSQKALFPGDEAAIYLHRQIPLLLGIGRKRWRNADALARQGIRFQILDDGRQHHRMYRDLDIIIMDTMHPDGGGLLPWGTRREPLYLLRHCDAIILSKWNQADERQKVHAINFLQNNAPQIAVLRALHSHALPTPLDPTYTGLQNRDWCNEPVVAVCALARPESFLSTLNEELKVRVLARYTFPDHHHYTEKDIVSILHKNTYPILITEKDAVKISRLPLSKEELSRIWVLPLRWEFMDGDQERFISILNEALRKKAIHD